MKRNDTTDNSTNRILALGIALTVGVWLVILLTGKQTEENPTTAKAPQPEAKEKAKASDGFDAAAEFRERHNRALSPEAREDHRRKLWEQNFPWKPTYDPANTVTAEMISAEPRSMKATYNHFDLKKFFDNELRFSPQFEQLYRIMEEYDRTENPLALGYAFDHLREYHRILREENLDELVRNSDGTPVMRRVRKDLRTHSDGTQSWKLTDEDEWETTTYKDRAESMKNGIASTIAAKSNWPHKEQMHYDQADEVVERLISEITGWEDVKADLVWGAPGGGDPEAIMAEFKEGDPLLVPYEGYQAGYDAWNDERNRAIIEGKARKRRKNFPAGILADGTLVNANNEPIQASAGSLGSFVNSGKPFALEETEDGHVRLSPEAMASLDERLRNKTPPQNANPPALTEEESRRQETIREDIIIIEHESAIEFRQE